MPGRSLEAVGLFRRTGTPLVHMEISDMKASSMVGVLSVLVAVTAAIAAAIGLFWKSGGPPFRSPPCAVKLPRYLAKAFTGMTRCSSVPGSRGRMQSCSFSAYPR